MADWYWPKYQNLAEQLAPEAGVHEGDIAPSFEVGIRIVG
jgi:hypothetical protein